jgi:hypothetical protein
MRLADERPESQQITRKRVARLMASGKLGERIVAAARAAVAVHAGTRVNLGTGEAGTPRPWHPGAGPWGDAA